MAKCSICARPVISDPHVLPSGQLIHDECRGGVFMPRERPKVIGRIGRPNPAATLRKPLRGGSGIFGLADATVVLFIAGDEDALLSYQALARAARLHAELARDAHEALVLAQLARPDVIVLDLRDGRIDGTWVLHRLNVGVSTRALPIVLVGPPPAEIADGRWDVEGWVHMASSEDALEIVRAVERVLENDVHHSDAVG
jgi:hypothetical protein